jgi:hypothetical protein
MCNPFNDANKWKNFLVRSSLISKRIFGYFLELPRLCTFVLLIRAASTWITVGSTDGIIVTGKNQRTQRKKSLSWYAFFHHKTQMDWPGSNPCLHVVGGGGEWEKKKLTNKGIVKDVFYCAGGGEKGSLVKKVFRPRTLALLVAVAWKYKYITINEEDVIMMLVIFWNKDRENLNSD